MSVIILMLLLACKAEPEPYCVDAYKYQCGEERIDLCVLDGRTWLAVAGGPGWYCERDGSCDGAVAIATEWCRRAAEEVTK